ncbi:MAG: hypothetical protein OXE59_02565 [Bacteroidetes bacterium]|nr:hypothetical protein [Bacteroidota bacterium]
MCFETGIELLRSGESAIHYYEKALKLGYPDAIEAVDCCRSNWVEKRSGRGIAICSGESLVDE